MIRRMTRLRVAGLRHDLSTTLETLQDLELVHLAECAPLQWSDGGARTEEDGGLSEDLDRGRRHLLEVLSQVEDALTGLAEYLPDGRRGAEWHVPDGLRTGYPATTDLTVRPPAVSCLTRLGFFHWARLGRRLAPRVQRLTEERRRLAEEYALLRKYRHLLQPFAELLRAQEHSDNLAAYQAMLSSGARTDDLRRAFDELLGGRVVVRDRRLPDGEVVLLILVRRQEAPVVERVFSEVGVEEIPVPKGYGTGSFGAAAPMMLSRLTEIPKTIDHIDREMSALAHRHGADLMRGQAALHDALSETQATPLAAHTDRTFVLEGWVPCDEIARLRESLEKALDGRVMLEVVAESGVDGSEAPVCLRNHPFIRPFEILVMFLPLPRYGTVDPTPLIALFFPLFFGLILGDVGYGLLVTLIGALLMRRSGRSETLRAVGYVATVSGLSAVLFGFAYGEAFGDLGHELGLRPLLFDREGEPVASLLAAIAIGLIHVVLGLVLGFANAWGESRRHAAASAAAAVVLLAVTAGLASAALEWGATATAVFFAVGLTALLALPVLGGVAALIEIVSAFGNVLSYARLMALGTASVMLALVANRLGGEAGAVGLFAAFLLHTVNLVLGMFSPTIHSLRLHYVEFFGKFYRPGGTPYRPFGHWRPTTSAHTM